MAQFELASDYSPAGDQEQAIAKLHPLKPSRTDAPLKNLEKANSYQLFNSEMKEFSFTKSRIGIGIGFAATVAVISALSVQAADLSSAKLMEVVKDVRILPPGGNPISATVGASISGKTAVTTGRRSRAELEFNDRTLMRIGSSTTFSMAGGRDVNLEKGALLLQTPDGQGNGVRIRAGGVTAAITGSMGLVSLSEPTDRKRKDSELFFKFISIHGDMHLELDGRVFDLKPFQMLFLRLDPTGKIIAEPIINTIDGSKLIKTSDLVQGFKDDSRLMQPPISNRLANQFREKKSNRWNVVTTDSSNRIPGLFRNLVTGRNAVIPPPVRPPAPVIVRPTAQPQQNNPAPPPPPPPPPLQDGSETPISDPFNGALKSPNSEANF